MLALVATVLAACSSDDPPVSGAAGASSAANERPGRGGRLVYALEGSPNGLDPSRNAFDRVGSMVAGALYDPLAAFDADANVRPYLAERLDPNADGTRWTFRLRPGVRFHSGAPLDASAVVRFARAIADSPVIGPAARNIIGVEATGELTGVVRMRKPWTTFPAILTGQGGYVVSARQLDDPEGEQHPDGTGPFRLKRWDLGEELVLVRNESYWRAGLPFLDAVDFRVVPDAADRLAGLRRGDLDVAAANNPQEVREFEAAAGDDVHAGSGVPIHVERDSGPVDADVVVFNTAVPPLDDVRVRRALSYATDRRALARVAGWSEDDLQDGPFHRDSPWYVDAGVPGYDPDRARALVAEYLADARRQGGDGTIRVRLLGAFDVAVLRALAGQWAAVGVTATLEEIDLTRHIVIAVVGGYQTELLRYFGTVDPDGLWPFFSSETYGDPGTISLNVARLRDPGIDRAMDAGRATIDRDRRKEAYAAFQHRLADVVPGVFLARSSWYIASGPRIHDARNVSLPDGAAALPYLTGVHRLTETWLGR